MTNEQFVEGWTLGENNFAAAPPNAVLSYIDAGDEPTGGLRCHTERSEDRC